MKYDFETIIDRRSTGSSKWDQMIRCNLDVSRGVVPFSVADMELKNPPEITEGLKKYIDSTILGYTQPTDSYLWKQGYVLLPREARVCLASYDCLRV